MKGLKPSLPCGNRDHNPARLSVSPHSTYLARDFNIVYRFSLLFPPLGRFKFLEPLKDYPTFNGLLFTDLRTLFSKVFTTFAFFTLMAGAVGLEPTVVRRRRFWRPMHSPLCDTPIYLAESLRFELRSGSYPLTR